MPTQEIVTLYLFDELGDKAKERARDWFRGLRDASDLDYVIEDFQRVCEALGIDLLGRAVRTMGGGARTVPAVSWSLGYTQSDFAAFEGSYAYKPGAAKAVREYAPKDEALHAIADALQAVQARFFYRLRADITEHHHYGLQVEVQRTDGAEVGDEAYKPVKCAMRELAQWLYRSLRDADEADSEDEAVEENIRANDYTFREDGSRWGG